MTETSQERRQFSRIAFDAWAELRQGERLWHAAVLDMSLKGLLVREPENWFVEPDQPIQAAVRLGHHCHIEMRVRLRHRGNGRAGFECEHIDLDSISNLRRLVELNLGDPELLERQLGALGRG